MGEKPPATRQRPWATKQAPRGAQPSQRTQLKKSDCPSTEGGARAQGTLEMAADRALSPRGEGAWGRALRLAGWLPAKGHPPPGEGQLRGAGREDLAKRPATHQHRRSASELRTPRSREERDQDSRWCRHLRRGLPLTHRLHRDEAAGAGSDQAREVEVNRGQSGCSLQTGRLPLTQGECRVPCS